MPYYPTFAFFEKPVPIKNVAQVLVDMLGGDLTEIGFMVEDKRIITVTREETLRFLQKDLPFFRFWLANDLHSMECALTLKGYLAVDFWDFDSEWYDNGDPSKEMKTEKRQLALNLHAAIIERCGALLSYTSSADHKYCGFDGHYETADMIYDSIRRQEFNVLSLILARPLFFWLLGLRKPIAAGVLREQVRIDFGEVYRNNQAVIFEHKTSRPFFLAD